MTPKDRRKSKRLLLSGEELKVHEITIVQSVVRQWLAKRWLRRARMLLLKFVEYKLTTFSQDVAELWLRRSFLLRRHM